MQKGKLFFCFGLFYSCFVQAQNKLSNDSIQGKTIAISAGFDIPYDETTKSYRVGIGAEFCLSNHRFGRLSQKPSKAIGFIFRGGFDRYFGKEKFIPGTTSFRVSDFNYIHAYGGAIYNTGKRGNINLAAGPALAVEYGLVEFFLGVNLSGSYYITNRIAISPEIIYMQKSDFIYDPVVAISVKASLTF